MSFIIIILGGGSENDAQAFALIKKFGYPLIVTLVTFYVHNSAEPVARTRQPLSPCRRAWESTEMYVKTHTILLHIYVVHGCSSSKLPYNYNNKVFIDVELLTKVRRTYQTQLIHMEKATKRLSYRIGPIGGYVRSCERTLQANPYCSSIYLMQCFCPHRELSHNQLLPTNLIYYCLNVQIPNEVLISFLFFFLTWKEVLICSYIDVDVRLLLLCQ